MISNQTKGSKLKHKCARENRRKVCQRIELAIVGDKLRWRRAGYGLVSETVKRREEEGGEDEQDALSLSLSLLIFSVFFSWLFYDMFGGISFMWALEENLGDCKL